MAVDPARAKSLFLEASDLDSAAERAAYLDRECGGDAELRARVEALLAAHDGAGRFSEPDATGVSQPELAATREMSRASVLERPPHSELITGEHRLEGDVATIVGAPSANRSSVFVPGQVIAGRYTLLEILGEGGWGPSTGPTRPNRSSGRWR